MAKLVLKDVLTLITRTSLLISVRVVMTAVKSAILKIKPIVSIVFLGHVTIIIF